MLEFSGKHEKGKIKVKAKISLVEPALDNFTNQIQNASKQAKKLGDALGALGAPATSSNYIFTLLNPQDPYYFITRKADKYHFSIWTTCKADYDAMLDVVRIRIKFAENIEGVKSVEKMLVVQVTNHVMYSSNKAHLKDIILKQFAGMMAEYTQLDKYEAYVLLSNLINIPGLPETNFNGTLYGTPSGGFVNPAPLPDVWNPPEGAEVVTAMAWALDSGKIDPSIASLKLPGMSEELDCPHCNQTKSRLWDLVQHLNDSAMWSREKIADWLDSLADDGIIDIDFKIPEIEEDSQLATEVEEFLKNDKF